MKITDYHNYINPDTTAAPNRFSTPEILLSNKRVEAFKKGVEEAHREEVAFLDQILHMPFFEFCLQVKERKERLEGELNETDTNTHC